MVKLNLLDMVVLLNAKAEWPPRPPTPLASQPIKQEAASTGVGLSALGKIVPSAHPQNPPTGPSSLDCELCAGKDQSEAAVELPRRVASWPLCKSDRSCKDDVLRAFR